MGGWCSGVEEWYAGSEGGESAVEERYIGNAGGSVVEQWFIDSADGGLVAV